MAQAKQFEKAALVTGILSTAENRRADLFSVLEECFGSVRLVSETMDFPYTAYYDSEMGGHPVRYLLMFEKLRDPSELSEIKLKTNALEALFAEKNGETACLGRRINIDPGILSLSNFILATCKDRSHRIPLSDGVYGEVTLLYKDRDFQSLPWTYADYASEEVRAVLRDFRQEYRRLLKQQ